MGSDIHVYVERKINNLWHAIKMEDPDYLVDPWATEPETYDWLYYDRNYRIFAILAGVRNYDNWNPLFAYRGLPNDISMEIKSKSDEWGRDAHSHTWIVLKELKEIDREYPIGTIKRWVDRVTYNNYKDKRILPNSFYYEPSKGLVELTWELTYGDVLGGFIDYISEKLDSIDIEDNLRLIIWFDS